jgi:hypothetical protein
MHPLVRAAAAVAVLTALGSLDRGPRAQAPAVVAPAQARGVDGMPALCPPGTLPEGPVCLRLPPDEPASARANVLAADRALADRTPADRALADRALADRLGADQPGAEIPRGPDRPEDPARYLFPIGSSEHPPRVVRGFGKDRDAPGIVLAARPGEKVTVVTLDQQEGAAELVFAGDRDGPTLATSHLVREGGQLRAYLVIYGKLDHFAPDLAVGASLEPGATLGHAAVHRASEGLVEITLEARQLREGGRLGELDAKKLGDPALSIPTDLRNVLPLALPPEK